MVLLKTRKIENFAMLVVSTFLGGAGQLLFKYAFLNQVIYALVLGLLAYGVSTIIYLFVLSRVHLSWAYSLGGMSYVFAAIFAAAILTENVPILRWVGVGVIVVGVALIGIS